MTSILFHARKNEKDRTPVFTIRFGLDEKNPSILFCAISKPHIELEPYCRKTGNRITDARLEYLGIEYQDAIEERHNAKKITVIEDIASAKEYLPRGVTKALSFYVQKAKRFFKIEKPIRLVIRGTEVHWVNENDYRVRAQRNTVILITTC